MMATERTQDASMGAMLPDLAVILIRGHQRTIGSLLRERQ